VGASVNTQMLIKGRIMPRETLDRQVHHLQDEVLLLGSMVEKAMLDAVDALVRQDFKNAQQIFSDDRLINEKRYAIENAVLILIATQQPMARDLRLLTAILEVITELERMGDYAKGIAKVTLRLGDASIPINPRDFSAMVEKAVSMLHQALSAFTTENPQLAHDIPLEDQIVDDYYNQIYRQIIEAMIANPVIIDSANLLLWVAHNIERMADRATNICERTVFIATGELMEMDLEDGEELDIA
jgi:phosphate transport system protein